MFSSKYFNVSLWILILSIYGCIVILTCQLWQMDRKVVHFNPFLNTSSGALRGGENARCFQKRWQKWQGHKTGRPERAPYSSSPDMGREPKPHRAEWTETNNGAFLWNSKPCIIKSKSSIRKVAESHASPIMWAQERGIKRIYMCVCVCIM